LVIFQNHQGTEDQTLGVTAAEATYMTHFDVT